MPFQCTKCGSTRIEEQPAERPGDETAIEIYCAGCGVTLVRPPTSATVTYDSILAELCGDNITDLTPNELGFLVARPIPQIISALTKLRRFGLAFCLELDLEGFEASTGPEGHWVAGGSLDVLRARARKNRFHLLHFDLGLDIAVNSDVEIVKPPRTA